MTNSSYSDFDIAIVGMACRFPGARNTAEFWANLRDGVESIRFFTEEELVALGVDREVIRDPRFVPCGPTLAEIDSFDADFFGYSPREASMLDPQQRIFLECAWHALEDAGHCPTRFNGKIAVFAGSSASGYLLFNLLRSDEINSREDAFDLMLANDKDFLATRVSYELGLTGPSISVQTGCSTSLVACHLAVQSLLSYQCDLALAGGVSVHVPQNTGYFHTPGGITSPDGHCRPFDAQASGTLFGSGVGIVVLSRLQDALRRRDQIYAIIRSSAVGNDGSAKLGYTAPSAAGQAETIASAHALAGIDPATITYIETHGTGTPLGDPIEIAALTTAFRRHTRALQFCALGSVKSNIGHLDAAAGIAGLLKTALALKHRQIPPAIHFEVPNARIDFNSSPFFVNRSLLDWRTGDTPLRAGVSSFGIGGTNAHLVLEEPPKIPKRTTSRSSEMIVISAESQQAIEQTTDRLADAFRQSELSLCDVSYTLLNGRKLLRHRRAFVCSSQDEAQRILISRDPEALSTLECEVVGREVAVLIPGGGAQHLWMGWDLYNEESVFRESLQRCAEICSRDLDFDLLELIYPKHPSAASATCLHRRHSVGLPALLAVEYSIAQLWKAWGIHPRAFLGHSLGEYTAACLAGTFSLESALAVVCLRGRLFEQLPPGAMLAVQMDESRLRELMGTNLSIAAINGPEDWVLSGHIEQIQNFQSQLGRLGVTCQKLPIEVAAHSEVIESILPSFERFMRSIPMRPPSVPFVSNLTGDWITGVQAQDPAYWAQQLRSTVRFGEGIGKILAQKEWALLELGPGKTLSSLARVHPEAHNRVIVSSLRHPNQRVSDVHSALRAAARLWQAGCTFNADTFCEAGKPHRVSLPLYPFARQSFWIPPSPRNASNRSRQISKTYDPNTWTNVPSWRWSSGPSTELSNPRRIWVIVRDERGIGKALARLVRPHAEAVLEIVLENYQYGVREAVDGVLHVRHPYMSLAKSICQKPGDQVNIVHLATAGEPSSGPGDIYDLAQLTRAFEVSKAEVRLAIVTSNATRVESTDIISPEKSMLMGFAFTLAQEHEKLTAQFFDFSQLDRPISAAETLLMEMQYEPLDKVVAWRGRQRWVREFRPYPLESRSVTENAGQHPAKTYLITGGLGTVGMTLARRLVASEGARIVLTTPSAFPLAKDWASIQSSVPSDDPIRLRIEELGRIDPENRHIDVVSADVANENEMARVVAGMRGTVGLDRIIHLAGVSGLKAFRMAADLTLADISSQWRAKVDGAKVLRTVLDGDSSPFVMLFSSTASVLGGIGLGAYAAANCYLDALAIEQRMLGKNWMSVGWDGWPLTADAVEPPQFAPTNIDRLRMTEDEATGVFNALANTGSLGHVVVSTAELSNRIAFWIDGKHETKFVVRSASAAQTPVSRSPRTPTEELVTRVWEEVLGIDRPGLGENFFELGGNSLNALRVISRLRTELGMEVAVITLFEGPTIRGLAALLDKGHAFSSEAARSRGETRLKSRRTLPR